MILFSEEKELQPSVVVFPVHRQETTHHMSSSAQPPAAHQNKMLPCVLDPTVRQSKMEVEGSIHWKVTKGVGVALRLKTSLLPSSVVEDTLLIPEESG